MPGIKPCSSLTAACAVHFVHFAHFSCAFDDRTVTAQSLEPAESTQTPDSGSFPGTDCAEGKCDAGTPGELDGPNELGSACIEGKQCRDGTVELCVDGFWQFSERCSGGCVGGACVVCQPGDTQCVGATPRTCAPEGDWVAAAPCSGELPVCVPATASCVCEEGASACAGTSAERRCIDGAVVQTACDADSLCEVDGCRVQAWTEQFGAAGSSDFAHSLSVDANGNVLVAGITFGELPGQVHSGGQDSFVRKYDPRGTALWTQQFGIVDQSGFSIFVIAHAVATDASGNAFVGGQVGNGSLTNQQQVGGGFVRKFGPGSNELWTTQFAVGEGTFTEVRAIEVDASGNLIIAGNQSSGSFVSKLTPSGSPTWTAIEDDGYVQGHSLSVDAAGNVLVAGVLVRKYDPEGNVLWTIDDAAFGGTPACVDVDGAGNVFVVGSTTGGVVLRKHDPDGNVLWTSPVFGSNSPHALSVDASGNALVASNNSGEPLPGQTSFGDGDLFVKRYDPEGAEVWARQLGTSAFDRVFSVGMDAKGSVLLAGQTSGTLSGNTIMNGGDAFVLKLLD